MSTTLKAINEKLAKAQTPSGGVDVRLSRMQGGLQWFRWDPKTESLTEAIRPAGKTVASQPLTAWVAEGVGVWKDVLADDMRRAEDAAGWDDDGRGPKDEDDDEDDVNPPSPPPADVNADVPGSAGAVPPAAPPAGPANPAPRAEVRPGRVGTFAFLRGLSFTFSALKKGAIAHYRGGKYRVRPDGTILGENPVARRALARIPNGVAIW